MRQCSDEVAALLAIFLRFMDIRNLVRSENRKIATCIGNIARQLRGEEMSKEVSSQLFSWLQGLGK